MNKKIKMTNGECAYKTHKKILVSGNHLPEWEILPEDLKNVWEHVAAAVLKNNEDLVAAAIMATLKSKD